MRFLEKLLLPLLGIIFLSVMAKGQCDSSSIKTKGNTRIITEQCYQSIRTEYNALQDYKTSSDSIIASLQRELQNRTKIGIALSILESNFYKTATDLSVSNQSLSELALQTNATLKQSQIHLIAEKKKSKRNLYIGGSLVLTLELAGAIGYYFLSR